MGVGTGSARDLRRAGAALARATTGLARVVTTVASEPGRGAAEAARSFVEGFLLGAYTSPTFGGATPGSSGAPSEAAPELVLLGKHEELVAATAVRATASARATWLVRDLAATPSNLKNPQWVAEQAADLSRATGLRVTVLDVEALAAGGFGGILAVGAGSVRPPRLTKLTWRPAGSARAPHLVLVGKGITFDTGGISIKPAAGMHLMRTDMSGGAAVIAALRGIAELGLPIRVTGLVPSAENHVSGSAYRPGDIVRHYGGRTTQVTNTDAEGRLVLADALAYAAKTLRPDAMVDVATLTGAMKVALGLRIGGLFASSDDLAERIDAAGTEVGERWWRMPLLDAHADDVVSDIADLRQCPPGPGGVTAALFLREFSDGLPWAHLDIAGPARAESAYAEVVPGGTGFAARSLVALAESYARSFSQ